MSTYDSRIIKLIRHRIAEAEWERVLYKCRWEHMTISAVLQAWWKHEWNTAKAFLDECDARDAQTPREMGK